ncbi:MAG: hypothetical protein OEL87_01490 [Nanoarchaeota archaeon]|nr:hypothetical protein [Nanoarchaeota archaeon]
MVERVKSSKFAPVIEHLCTSKIVRGKNCYFKKDILKLERFIEFYSTEKYSKTELEMIYYLMRAFLAEKKISSYRKFYNLILKDAGRNKKTGKLFKYLPSRKKDFEDTLKTLRGKNVLLAIEVKNKAMRKIHGLGERGSNKYFKLDIKKISEEFDVSFSEIYFILHYLLLEKSNYDDSCDEVDSKVEKLNEFFGDK